MNYSKVADEATRIGTAVVLIALCVIVFVFSSKGRKIEQQKQTIYETVTETTVEMTNETKNTNYTVASTNSHDLGVFKLTAYCPCEKCCGKYADGKTASGTIATAGRTIAVDPEVFPYGTKLLINGVVYVAEDCGGAVNGKCIDIFFDTHEEAVEFGVQYANVQLKGSD